MVQVAGCFIVTLYIHHLYDILHLQQKIPKV